MRKIQLLRKKSSTDRITRAISYGDLAPGIPCKEENQADLSAYYPNYDFHREVMNALVEAEKNKAKAIMYYQRRISTY